MEPLVGKPLHHLQQLRTVHLDWLRRCPQQSVDSDHYGPDGACFCKTKRLKMTKEGLLRDPLPKNTQPPNVIISVITRPPPGRNRVRH